LSNDPASFDSGVFPAVAGLRREIHSVQSEFRSLSHLNRVTRALMAFRVKNKLAPRLLRHFNLSNAAAYQLDDQVPKFIESDASTTVFRITFDLRCTAKKLFPFVDAKVTTPRKRLRFRHAEPRAEKRVTLWCLPGCHLSVDFRRVREKG
jgi:hypothetical protein